MPIIIIAINITSGPAFDVQLEDLNNQIIPSGDQFILTQTYTTSEIYQSQDLIDAINNDEILLNDGTTTLTKEESLGFVTEVPSPDVPVTFDDLSDVIYALPIESGSIPIYGYSYGYGYEGSWSNVNAIDYFNTIGFSGVSGFSGESGVSGFSGESGFSGYSGVSGFSGYSGVSGYSGFSGESGFSGQDGAGVTALDELDDVTLTAPDDGDILIYGYSYGYGTANEWTNVDAVDYFNALGLSGISGFSGYSGVSGFSGFSGYSGVSGFSGYSGVSGFSGYSGVSGFSGYSGTDGDNQLGDVSITDPEDGDILIYGYSYGYGTANEWTNVDAVDYFNALGLSGASGFSGYSGVSGFSGYSGVSGFSGYSGVSGFSGYSGVSGFSGYSGVSGFSGSDATGAQELNDLTDVTLTSPDDGDMLIYGYSYGYGTVNEWTNVDAVDYFNAIGLSGTSGFSGYSGVSGFSGYSGVSGFSGYSGVSGFSGYSGVSGFSGYSGVSGFSGYSGVSGQSDIMDMDDLEDVTLVPTVEAGDMLIYGYSYGFGVANQWSNVDALDYLVAIGLGGAGEYGEMYVSSTAPTSVPTNGVYVKGAGTTVLNNGNNFSMPVNNRLRYDGDGTKFFLIAAEMSATTDNSNHILSFRIAKNGTTLSYTQIDRKISSGQDVGASGLMAIVELTTNDYLEVWVTNDVDSSNVTLERFIFTVTSIGGAGTSGFSGAAPTASYGEMSISSTAATTISSAGTYVKVAGTTLLGDNSLFSMPMNNRLRYDSTETREFQVNVETSTISDTNNVVVSYRIAKNGTTLSDSQIDRRIGTGSDVGANGITTIVELTMSDYVELFVTCDTGTVDLTTQKMSFVIIAVAGGGESGFSGVSGFSAISIRIVPQYFT